MFALPRVDGVEAGGVEGGSADEDLWRVPCDVFRLFKGGSSGSSSDLALGASALPVVDDTVVASEGARSFDPASNSLG